MCLIRLLMSFLMHQGREGVAVGGFFFRGGVMTLDAHAATQHVR